MHKTFVTEPKCTKNIQLHFFPELFPLLLLIFPHKCLRFLCGCSGMVIKISYLYLCLISSHSTFHAPQWLTAVPQETFGTSVKDRPQISRVQLTLKLRIPLWTKHTAWPWQSGYCPLSPCAGCTPAASDTHSRWPRWTADPCGQRNQLIFAYAGF